MYYFYMTMFLNLTDLQFSLEDNLAAVGHDVLPLPARDTLLQLAEFVERLLARLTAGAVSRNQIISTSQEVQTYLRYTIYNNMLHTIYTIYTMYSIYIVRIVFFT